MFSNDNTGMYMPVAPAATNYGNNGFGLGGDGAWWLLVLFLFAANNGWNNGLNWGNKKGDDPHALSLNGGDNFKITGITGTTTVTVTVDVKNLTCTWVIN